MAEQAENDVVLELIPGDQLQPWLNSIRPASPEFNLPLHRMRREPSYLNELNCHEGVATGAGIIIWCEKYGVLICITKNYYYRVLEQYLCFQMYDEAHKTTTAYAIVGNSQAVAEAATFLWSLKLSSDSKSSSRLEVLLPKTNYVFDSDALQPEQLARALDANPERHYCFKFGSLSPEQSVVLATRVYPLNIWIKGVAFKDKGTAFVDALENRQNPTFGLFKFEYWYDQEMPISSTNFHRLFALEITFDTLKMCQLDRECAHLPFSARANIISYAFDISQFRPSDFDGMNILAKELDFQVSEDASLDAPDWGICLALLFDRVAGHLEKMCLSVGNFKYGHDGTDSSHVVQALIRLINTNSKLKYLDIGDIRRLFEWHDDARDVFKAMESHPGLRTFIFDTIGPYAYDSDDDEDFYKECCADAYYGLEQLLTRNRFITVYDDDGRCTNGGSIDKVYLRNDFFNGSEKLVKDSTPERSLLVATSLVDSASHNFQFIAWLLFHHPDVLCELFYGTGLEPAAPQETVLLTSIPSVASEDSKRGMSEALPRATKKAALG